MTDETVSIFIYHYPSNAIGALSCNAEPIKSTYLGLIEEITVIVVKSKFQVHL